MRKQDVIDYCLKTPYNTNPNLLNQFIDEMDISGSTAPLVERDGAKIYGVVIDTYADSLDNAMTYIFDAVNIQPGPDSWFERWPFNLIKPCVFNNGEVMYYLDKNNFNKKENGETALIDGTDGDVMIEFPRVAYSVGYDKTGRYLTVCITDKKVDLEKFYMAGREFSNYAFSVGTGIKDKFYIGAFLNSTNSSGNTGSYSGFTPISGQTIDAAVVSAEAKGSGYYPVGYYQMSLIQVLFIIMYKSIDSVVKIGYGRCGQEGTQQALSTGVTLEKGMNTSESNDSKEIAAKLFGIEDIYGNLNYVVGGVAETGTYFSDTDVLEKVFVSNKYFKNEDVIKNGIELLRFPYFKSGLGGSKVLGLNDAPFFGIGSDSDYKLGFKAYGDMEAGHNSSWSFLFGKDFKYLKKGSLFNTIIGCSGGLPETYTGSRFMYL